MFSRVNGCFRQSIGFAAVFFWTGTAFSVVVYNRMCVSVVIVPSLTLSFSPIKNDGRFRLLSDPGARVNFETVPRVCLTGSAGGKPPKNEQLFCTDTGGGCCKSTADGIFIPNSNSHCMVYLLTFGCCFIVNLGKQTIH